MRDRFVPPSYHRELRKKLMRLEQGDKSVQDYYAELQKGLQHYGIVGAKAKTLPFAPAFVYPAAPMEAEEPARSTLRLVHYETKAYDGVPPSHVLTRPGGPRGIRPIVTGPAWRSVLQAQFLIALL
jgi:hypothetical protein